MKKQTIFYLFIACFTCSSFQLQSQCYPDRHNTSWFNGWASCTEAASPNDARGDSHWILYDLNEVYKLGKTHIWNTNDPKHLDWGIDQVAVDVSLDGQNWTEIGTYNWSQANGLPIYEGEIGPDLSGHEASFVLLTALSNHGGDCYGFSEIRIEAEETGIVSAVQNLSYNDCFNLSAFPNPFTDDVRVDVNASCTGEMEFILTDVLGRIVQQGWHQIGEGKNTLPLNLRDSPSGTYYLRTKQGIYSSQISLVKM